MIETVVWLRRDVRSLDNPAVARAIHSTQGSILLAVVIDPREVDAKRMSRARRQVYLMALISFQQMLRSHGIPLVIFHGEPESVIPACCAAVRARQLVFARDVNPSAKRRDQLVQVLANRFGIHVEMVEERTITNLQDVMPAGTVDGPRSYLRFSPFYRKWQLVEHRNVAPPIPLHEPHRFADLPAGVMTLATADNLLREELGSVARETQQSFSEATMLVQFASFVRAKIWKSRDGRDELLDNGASGLSFALSSGILSARWMEAVIRQSVENELDREAYLRQLCWRDFYYHLMDVHPITATEPLRQMDDGHLYPATEETVRDFIDGNTGFPIVDAAMRQLRSTGQMSNRLRMVVASFATKQLGIHWKTGERHFSRYLLDFDLPLNVGNWQWCASVGTDAQPYFRMFDPVRQSKLFDPNGEYIRRYVPELQNVPTRYVHEPWKMSVVDQQQSGCMIGMTYPFPMVELTTARDEALQRLRSSL